MKFYVIIDTNVIASALYTDNDDSPTYKILEKLYSGDITIFYSDEILAEYKEVLNRVKFDFSNSVIGTFINFIKDNGIYVKPEKLDIIIPDMNDIMFYELVVDKSIKNERILVTGNKKDFPISPKIVTPAEFMEIFNRKK